MLVIPCYGAEKWLRTEEIIEWLRRTEAEADAVHVRILFVHDGSTQDATPRKINRWLNSIAYSNAGRAQPGRVRIMQSKRRLGRAEAVRQGLLECLTWPDHFAGANGGSPTFVGLWSEDLAALGPPVSAASLAAAFSARPDTHMVFGSGATQCTVGMTIAPFVLGQRGCACHSMLASGARLFRVSPTLRTVLQFPFRVPDLFICELIARYTAVLGAGQGDDTTATGHSQLMSQLGLANCSASTLLYEAEEPNYTVEADESPACDGTRGGTRGGGACPSTLGVGGGGEGQQLHFIRALLGLLTLRVRYYMRAWPGGTPKLELALFVALVVACASVLVAGFRLATATTLLSKEVAMQSARQGTQQHAQQPPAPPGWLSKARLRGWPKWNLRVR